MKNYFNFFLIGFAFLIAGCSSDSTDDLSEPTSIEGPITYNDHVESIFEGECVKCHAGAMAPAGLRLETYDQVRDAVEFGNVLSRMTNAESPMPPASEGGLLLSSTIEIVQRWVEDGYLEE